MKRPTHFYLFKLLWPLLTLAFSGCVSIEHVSLLRSQQERFSAVASEENRYATQFISETQADLQARFNNWNGPGPLQVNAEYEQLVTWNQEYSYIVATLEVLLKHSNQALEQDGLLAVAEALHLFAQWRAAYTGHMCHALLDTAHTDQQYSALTEIAAQAVALAKQETTKHMLGPRDLAMLRGIPAIAEFEAVIIDILKNKIFLNDPASAKQDAIYYIDAIRNAELKFKDSDPGFHADNLKRYYVSTRLIMLATGYNIYTQSGLNSWVNTKSPQLSTVIHPERSAQTYAQLLQPFFVAVAAMVQHEQQGAVLKKLPSPGKLKAINDTLAALID